MGKLYDTDNVTTAIGTTLSTPNRLDANGEPANVVDGLYAIADALNRVAEAVSDKGQVRVEMDSAAQARFNRMFSGRTAADGPQATEARR